MAQAPPTLGAPSCSTTSMRLPPASFKIACLHFCVVMSPMRVLTPRVGLMDTRSTPITRLPTGIVLTATWHQPPAGEKRVGTWVGRLQRLSRLRAGAALHCNHGADETGRLAGHKELAAVPAHQAAAAGGGGAPGAAHRSKQDRAPERKSYLRLSWMSLKAARER